MKLQTALSFNGNDASTVSTNELEHLFKNGRKLEISITVLNSAPKSELETASSKEHYDAIVASYPSFISVLKADNVSEVQ